MPIVYAFGYRYRLGRLKSIGITTLELLVPYENRKLKQKKTKISFVLIDHFLDLLIDFQIKCFNTHIALLFDRLLNSSKLL